jgi:glyoxylase-like metal-dependent hydrolase (beta-lactamase superfamily II)
VSALEVRPGLYRVEEPDGGRRLCQYVVAGPERTLVVDAGLPASPEHGLLPLLRAIVPDRAPVVLVLTHPDADHRGGAAALRNALPDLEIWGHALDRAQLSDPEVALAERYLGFEASDGVGPAPERLSAIRSRLGPPVELDRVLAGATEVDLGVARRVRLLHAPGHSPGSVVAWLPDDAAALVGDAVMGRGIPLFDGSLLYPPMYAPPSAYLATIERLEALQPELMLAGHEPPLEGPEVARFLADSRDAASRLTTLVQQALAGDRPRTLAELCEAVAEGYGGLPSDGAANLAMTVDGTLTELIDLGEVAVDAGPPRQFAATR